MGKRIMREELLNAAELVRRDILSSIMTTKIVGQGNPIDSIINFVAIDGYFPQFFLIPQGLPSDLLSRTAELSKMEHKLKRNKNTTLWIVATSGTTGTPKFVAHTLSSLTRSIKKDVNIGLDLRWALLYDPCSFAGIQVILQSLLGGATLLIPPLDDLDKCVKFLCNEKCTSISSTPSMWRKLLSVKSISNLRLRHITLGGELADGKILKTLSKMYPRAKITHIYASTEAGVGFSVRDGKPGFPLDYLKGGLDGNVQLKVNSEGTLYIKCSKISQEYIDSEESLVNKNGFINTGDIVEIVRERVFFRGRANGSINIGGQKVMPEEVESVIRNCNGIKDVFVYGQKNPILGNVVVANLLIARIEQEVDIKNRVIEYCRQYLEPFKCPAIVRIVDDINLTSTNKKARNI